MVGAVSSPAATNSMQMGSLLDCWMSNFFLWNYWEIKCSGILKYYGNQEVLEVKPFVGHVYAGWASDCSEDLYKDHVIYTPASAPFVFFSSSRLYLFLYTDLHAQSNKSLPLQYASSFLLFLSKNVRKSFPRSPPQTRFIRPFYTYTVALSATCVCWNLVFFKFQTAHLISNNQKIPNR